MSVVHKHSLVRHNNYPNRMRIFLSLMLLSVTLCPTLDMQAQALSSGQGQFPEESAIQSIERQVIDLTDVTTLTRSDIFLKWRSHLTPGNCSNLISLIRSKSLSPQQCVIAVDAICVLPEEEYWKVTGPLLQDDLPSRVLEAIILPVACYGPGYANAYLVPDVVKKLELLTNRESVSATVKFLVRHVLSGEAARQYKRILRSPEEYNFRPKEILRPRRSQQIVNQ